MSPCPLYPAAYDGLALADGLTDGLALAEGDTLGDTLEDGDTLADGLSEAEPTTLLPAEPISHFDSVLS